MNHDTCSAPAANVSPVDESTCRKQGAAALRVPSETSKRRVLLVDDEEKILAALRRLLRREGYELYTANCGPEALKLLASQPAELVISDHRMPGMTGVELLREVRNRWPDMLRIILSGYSEVSTIIAAVNEGEIYKFISKPWNDEEFKLHVRRAMEQRELQAQNARLAGEIAEQNEQLRELNLLLEQRAADAHTGLISTQSLLETIETGVLTVDDDGLVVAANRWANEMLSGEGSGLIGLPAQVALPKSVHDLLSAARTGGGGDACGHLQHGGRRIQCRINSLSPEHRRRASVITLWEELA